MALQPSGNHPSTTGISEGSLVRVPGFALCDSSGAFISTLDGYYIDLGGGMPSGNGIGSSSLRVAPIASSNVAIGSGFGSGSFTPGDMV